MSFVPIVALAAMMSTTATVQAPASLGSPEVHADRRVTFRITAPKASEVTFQGDWHAGSRTMTRSAEGPWSITLGPLAPGTYIYSFTVDGVAMADPVNPRVKLRTQGSGSFFDVPADSPGLADARDVPHGTVALTWPPSSARHDNRPLWIYNPPGYAQGRDRRYQVLYLLHGGNDRPAGWIDIGHVNRLDDFASVGAFSPAPYDGLQAEHAALLTEPDETNARIDLLWLGCGRQDQATIGGKTLFATSQALAQQLAQHRIRHTWHPTDGAHNYAMWREHLIEFLPRVFQAQKQLGSRGSK